MQADEKAGDDEQETSDAKHSFAAAEENTRTADGEAADQQNDPDPNTRTVKPEVHDRGNFINVQRDADAETANHARSAHSI